MMKITKQLEHSLVAGDKVTVSCAEGDTGFIYKGELKFEPLGSVRPADIFQEFRLCATRVPLIKMMRYRHLYYPVTGSGLCV